MVNPKSLANLKQNKGVIPAPGPGRPKGSVSLVVALKHRLAADPTIVEGLVTEWIKQARENPIMFRELLERVDGKVTGEDTIKAKIEVTVRWDGNRNTTTTSGTPPPATPAAS